MPVKRPQRLTARRRLDERLASLSQAVGPRPAGGWIRAIRESLGMTTSQLAERMGVSQARVTQVEHGEVERSLRLSTLDRAAEALNCRVIYALLPHEPLEEMVRRQAKAIAGDAVASTSHNMRLEDQAPDARIVELLVDEIANELVDAPGLWKPTKEPV
jgi:predicted DNA-binding mobile mystery protein A